MSREKVRLADIASMRTGKLDSNASVPNGEYPFFTCSQQTMRINKPAFDTEAVLLGGNNAAGVFPLKYYHGQFNAYQRTYVIESLNQNILNTRFLFYALRPALLHFQSASIGAATQYLTKGILDNFPLLLPPIREQQRIVDVLSAYDDLIENNRRRIQLLEQAARLLYKEWFVRLHFPGHEHVKIKEGVPEGWEKLTTGEASCFLKRGITPKYDEEAKGLVINQKCIRNSLVNMSLARRQSKEVPPSKIVQYGDVLINSTGEGTLGRVAQFLSQIENCTADSHITIARPAEGIPKLYFGYRISSMEDYLASMGRGATNQTELSKDTIADIPFILPPKSIAQDFELTVANTSRQIQILTSQNYKLTEARDLLLPRLMNGEIAV